MPFSYLWSQGRKTLHSMACSTKSICAPSVIQLVSINREFGYYGAAVLLAISKDRPKMAALIGRSVRIHGEFEIEIFELRTI